MDWNKVLQSLLEFATSWGIKLLCALVLLFVGLKLIKRLKNFIKFSPKLDKLDAGLRSFIASFANIALYIMLVITLASVLGIPATSFITILASCGVAIGLALQGALSNFAGGLMLLLFKPFKVGDFVRVSEEEGKVLEISVVYTVILTSDNKRITIPNGTLTNEVIINYSAEELRRVDMVFSTAYDCDIEKTKAIIMKVITSHPKTLDTPEPLVRLAEHADSALKFNVRAWCKNDDYWSVKYDIIEKVKEEFDKNGIEIPYPQMDVHMKKD